MALEQNQFLPVSSQRRTNVDLKTSRRKRPGEDVQYVSISHWYCPVIGATESI